MLEVSDEYIELMDDETSVLDVSVSCTFGGTIILAGDVIQKIVLTEQVNGDSNILTLGNACSNSVSIVLVNPPALGYKGVSCVPKCGVGLPDGSVEQTPLGVFWVDKVKTDNDYRSVTLEAYDKMYKLASIPFTPPASEVAGKYKVLFENYVQRLEELASITVVRPEGGFPELYIEKRIEDGVYNCRDIAGHLAGCLGKNAKFNRYGDMEFIFYTQTAFKAVEELQYMRGFEKLSDNPLKIDFLITGTDDEPIELENDGTDPGELDWRYFDSCDPNDFPWLTFTYDDAAMTASVRLTEGYEADTAAIKIPYNLSYNGGIYIVTVVEENGFEDCMATEIALPDTLTTINGGAFKNCNNLTELTIPENVTYMGQEIAAGCNNLTTIHFDAVECSCPSSISSGPFHDLANETAVVIGTGVKTIGGGVFGYAGNVVLVNIPDTVTTIGGNAFRGCTKLKELEIPSSVTSIGSYALRDSGITSITIPSSVESLGQYAFEGCKSLVSANIQCSGVPQYCFSGCSALANVTLGHTLTTIGMRAFEDCKAVVEIAIPEPVTSIGNKAFTGCTSLRTVYYNAANWSYTGLSSGAPFGGLTSITNVVFGDTVVSIPKYALRGCTGITSLSIPSSVKTINTDAFSGCTGITQITVYKSTGGISGSPWGASNATISWVG